MFRAGQHQSTACRRILSGVLGAALFISLPAPQATMGPSVPLTAAPVTLTLPDAVPAVSQPQRPGALLYPRGWRHGPWIEAFRAHGRGWVLQTTGRSGSRQRRPTGPRRPGRTPAALAGRRSRRLPRVAPHVSPPPVPVAPAATCAVVECDPRTAIHWAATRWGASESELVAVARCESALNPQAYNASSGSSGLFQFLPATYWAYARLAAETRTYRLASAAANVAAWMFAHGLANQWTCA
jgi:Transglycosylase SLT domain